jgi:hypothetical protein
MPLNITAEDFDGWRENAVTKTVFGALDKVAALQQQHWIETSWGQGACTPEMLLELRTRADAYRSLSELSYERLREVLGETKEA